MVNSCWVVRFVVTLELVPLRTRAVLFCSPVMGAPFPAALIFAPRR